MNCWIDMRYERLIISRCMLLLAVCVVAGCHVTRKERTDDRIDYQYQYAEVYYLNTPVWGCLNFVPITIRNYFINKKIRKETYRKYVVCNQDSLRLINDRIQNADKVERPLRELYDVGIVVLLHNGVRIDTLASTTYPYRALQINGEAFIDGTLTMILVNDIARRDSLYREWIEDCFFYGDFLFSREEVEKGWFDKRWSDEIKAQYIHNLFMNNGETK